MKKPFFHFAAIAALVLPLVGFAADANAWQRPACPQWAWHHGRCYYQQPQPRFIPQHQQGSVFPVNDQGILAGSVRHNNDAAVYNQFAADCAAHHGGRIYSSWPGLRAGQKHCHADASWKVD